jgi:hypothetical protein
VLLEAPTPFAVPVQEHLGITVVAGKDVTAGLELAAQLAVVVDAAVEDDCQQALVR